MSEEKKEDTNEQQTFLNEHEELLKSIHKKEDPDTEQADATEEATEAVTEETPVIDDTPEPVVEEKPAAEEEPVVEEELEAEEEPEAAKEETEPSPEPEPTEAPEEAPQPVAAVEKQQPMAPAGRHSPQHEEVLRKQALEQSEVKEVLVFFRKYAKPVGIAIALVCVFVLADRFFKNQRFKKEAAADTALLEARSAADLQNVVDKYESTPSGPIAMMELARDKFNSGQFDEAEILYTQFSKAHGKHELADQATLNLITCKEAKGQFDEAHQLYGDFAASHEGSHLVPAALLGQARCLEAQGKLKEAQVAYEDISVNFSDTGWSRIAEANLKTVISKQQ